MSRYELLLFAHVLAAAAWLGAAVLSVVLMELASRAGDRAWIMKFGEFDDALAKVLFIPAALITLIAGIALVLEGPWGFVDDGWVLAGLITFGAIFAVGLGMIVPTSHRLVALGHSGAPEAEIDALLQRLRLLSWLDVALLVLAVFLMTVKPFS